MKGVMYIMKSDVERDHEWWDVYNEIRCVVKSDVERDQEGCDVE